MTNTSYIVFLDCINCNTYVIIYSLKTINTKQTKSKIITLARS